MRKIYVPILLLLVMFTGCSSKDETNMPGQPNVSQEQAIELAQDFYSLNVINNVELKHLDKNELANLTEQQKKLTPIYYVISGQIKNKKVRVYVSSNDLSHHFIIR